MAEDKAHGSPEIAERDYQRVVNAWAMYDWANSAFAVVILTAIFPVYFRALVINAGAAPETATAYWAYTTSLSLLLVALIGPVIGAAADFLGAKKRFLAVALSLGVLGTVSLAFLSRSEYQPPKRDADKTGAQGDISIRHPEPFGPIEPERVEHEQQTTAEIPERVTAR